MNEKYANIIVDVSAEALNKSFVFKVSEDLVDKVKVGDKVRFPFGKGNNEREGFVIEILTLDQLKERNFYKKETYFRSSDAIANLKSIYGLAEKKIGASETLLKIAIFLCKEYFCPLSNCLNTVLPVKREIRKNARQKDVTKNYNVNPEEKKEKDDIVLNDEQQKVVNSLISYIDVSSNSIDDGFSEHLVHGITGSGKTEVYIKVIEKVLKLGKKVIVLIPEIALTHQTVIRLKQKFSDNIAIIHSRMSEGERYLQYKKCETGETDILVGPRSAVFAPFENLGLIVMDEVNDKSYKSETNPRYNTLDIARYRCKLQGAMLLTLSATPNIDYYSEILNSNNDKFKLHRLSSRAASTLPKVTLVDMKEEFKSGNKSIFSRLLVEKINDRLKRGEQVMLYMNRRGYDTIFTCKECGETLKCPHCDVSLVSHNDGKLRCHYCNFEMNEPMTCPTCHSKEIEKYGMGTEKLEEECIDLFPSARVLRMDRDTTKEKNGHDKIIEKFKNGEADILIGTQMIVRGHDFPNVTLVAVMRGDLSLYAENYKAAEDTFSMITQCVGRSGRKVSGESIIQAYDTESFVMKVACEQDFDKFYKSEIEYRKKLNYPPFTKLLIIRLSATDVIYLDESSKSLKLCLDTKNDVDAVILGPTKTNPEKIKDVYSRMIIVKCKDTIYAKRFRRLADQFISKIDTGKLIKLTFDIE